tara:strand:+ start:4550 stop:4804 length:255 start_codon:yes stop_codon:yes gene_type:complete
MFAQKCLPKIGMYLGTTTASISGATVSVMSLPYSMSDKDIDISLETSSLLPYEFIFSDMTFYITLMIFIGIIFRDTVNLIRPKK